MSEVIVLYDGYSVMTGKDQMSANCSCTLLKGLHNVVIDTMTAWDSQKIITGMYYHTVKHFTEKYPLDFKSLIFRFFVLLQH